MDNLDLQMLSALQEGFPITSRPFQSLGDLLGISDSETLQRLEGLQKEGLIRRIGPILDMRRLGCSGVLVALSVPEQEADGVAQLVNRYPEVSHNYLRPNESGYNLWFTVSAKEERIEEILREIESLSGRKMLVLPTLRIFKIGVKFDIV
jgi:DNA-binding Lrp family transcriptional regulator